MLDHKVDAPATATVPCDPTVLPRIVLPPDTPPRSRIFVPPEINQVAVAFETVPMAKSAPMPVCLMVEPSAVNLDREVAVYGSADGTAWTRLKSWNKDGWPENLFQYGNASLATGNNSKNLLAFTTVAAEGCDLEAWLWRPGVRSAALGRDGL